MLRRLKRRESKQGEGQEKPNIDDDDILGDNEKEKEDTDDYEYFVKWTGKCYRKVRLTSDIIIAWRL